MRIRLAIPDHLITPEILEAALETTTLANQASIENGEAPLLTEAISKGLKWQEEPFIDGEHFDLAQVAAKRKWGDCDDLGPWLAAELRATGDDPGARTRILRTGRKRWHAVTETSDGQILDPSKWAGMGRRSGRTPNGVTPMIARPLAHVGGGALACLPGPNGYWARCDVPFGDAHLASHAHSKSRERAVAAAINGALVCGEGYDCPILDRAHAVGEFLLGDASDTLLPMAVGKIETLRQISKQPFIGKSIIKDQHMQLMRGYNSGAPYTPQDGNPPFSPKERFPTFDKFWQWALDQPIETHTHQKGMGVVKNLLKTALPMASNLLAPGAGTALSALTQGAGGVTLHPPEGGAVVRDPRSGAISVPLESPDAPHENHMFLMYHPLGNPGPVVMRF